MICYAVEITPSFPNPRTLSCKNYRFSHLRVVKSDGGTNVRAYVEWWISSYLEFFLFVFVSTRMIDMSNGTHVKMLRVECAYDAHTVKMLKVW